MSRPIYFIDLTHENQWGFGSDTFPMQLGLLAAYCKKLHGDEIDTAIFKHMKDLERAILERPPWMIAASNYMWNIDLGYKVVENIRQRYPEVITVFGGPNFPDEVDEQQSWLEDRAAVDFYIAKDGEAPFAGLVEHLLAHEDLVAAKTAKLPSVMAMHEGEAFFGELAPRMRDLSLVPSPYTLGMLDQFFDQRMVPAMLTNRGCPFKCTFCTEGIGYYNKVNKTSFERKKADIDYISERVKFTKTLRVADSNFGMFKEDEEFCEYVGEIQRRTGYPEYIMCSAGKNQKERILKCNELVGGAMRLTASVQSMNAEVLAKIKRTNVSVDDVMALSDQTSDGDTHSYSEIIVALPGDTIAAEEETISQLIEIGISNITQHQLALIYASELGSRESRSEFFMESRFRPVQRCFGSYSFLGEPFSAVEFEEICVETDTMPFADYVEARRLYLSVGLFYNDRIFGEIHGLLRVLGLSTFDWMHLIHNSVDQLPDTLRAIYQGFTQETIGELWPTREEMKEAIRRNLDQFVSGDQGSSVIYKWRAKAFLEHHEEVHAVAYEYLRKFLALNGVECEEAIEDIEILGKSKKWNLFDMGIETTHEFRYDLDRIVNDAKGGREANSLDDFRYPTTLRIAHTDRQRETLKRELEYHGQDISGLTRLMSQFPFKRFFRTAEKVETA